MGKYSLEIVLSAAESDANKILGRSKFAKHSIFKKVKTEIFLATRGKTPVTPLTQFKITAVRHGPGTLDYDNLITSLKPYIDGLRLAGIIIDDSIKYLNRENYFTHQVKSETRKIILTVEETEGMSI